MSFRFITLHLHKKRSVLMKKVISSALIVAATMSLQANDQSQDNAISKQGYSKKQYSFVRVGYKKASGDLNVDDLSSTWSIPEDEKGFEIAFGVNNTGDLFGWRPLLSLSSTSGDASGVVETKTIIFQGEFEFYAEFHKSFAPFIGFHGGIGKESFSNSYGYDESLTAAQLGISAGVSGLFVDNVGYYFKIARNYRNHEETSNGEFLDHTLTDTTFGVTLAF